MGCLEKGVIIRAMRLLASGVANVGCCTYKHISECLFDSIRTNGSREASFSLRIDNCTKLVVFILDCAEGSLTWQSYHDKRRLCKET